MKLEYFQMVDRIVALDLNARTIAAQARVPDSSPVFEGHFPGYPLMPGVLLIETMAQTAGWLVVGWLRFGSMAFLASVKSAKFRRFVMPGEPLDMTARLTHDGSGFAVADASISTGGAPVGDATLMLRTVPFPTPDLRVHMASTADRIGLTALVNQHG